MATERLCVIFKPVNYAIAQWTNYNFNSFCEFNGVALGSNEDGIYALTGDQDGTTNIDAFFELGPTNMGEDKQLKLRRLITSGEFGGDLLLTVYKGEGGAVEYDLTPVNKDMTQTTAETTLQLHHQDRFWSFRVENVDGCDFSIDMIDVLIALLARLIR